MTASNVPICITADEVNCLIYSYFLDSGFQHSAFAICKEGHLEQSPYFTKHIPRGELIELLSKALLYIEVEAHWKGDALATNCKTSFSLIEPHVCSLEAKLPPNSTFLPIISSRPLQSMKPNGMVHVVIDSGTKRKADSPSAEEERNEKRARRDVDEMEVETQPESKPKSEGSKPSTGSHGEASKKPSKPKPHLPGPSEPMVSSEAVRLLPGHKSEIFVCAWNPVHRDILASGSKDAVINFWKLPPSPTGENTAMLTIDSFSKPDQADITSLHWNPDGSLLAIGSYDGVLRIYTLTGESYFTHAQHQGPVFAAKFSPSGQWLLTASLDGSTCVWDVKEKKLHIQYRSHADCCLDVDWIDEATFVSCGADKLIHVMKIGQTTPIKLLRGHTKEINQVRCSPSRKWLASCSDDQSARIWDATNFDSTPELEPIPGLVTSTKSIMLSGHRHSVSGIAWLPNCPEDSHEMLATISFDGTARFWDAVTGECLKLMSDHRRPVYTLSFSPDGRWFLTGAGDGWLHVYDVAKREKLWSWWAGAEKPGVFEMDWQITDEGRYRLALALECRQVAIVDVDKVPALQV